MRSNGPETQLAFAAAGVKHTTQASSGRRSAVQSARAAAATPALSSRDSASPAPSSTFPRNPSSCRTRTHRQALGPVDGTQSPRSRTSSALVHTGKTRGACNRGQRRFHMVPTPLDAWQLPREKPRRGLHELERALDLRAKLRGRQKIAVDDESK